MTKPPDSNIGKPLVFCLIVSSLIWNVSADLGPPEPEITLEFEEGKIENASVIECDQRNCEEVLENSSDKQLLRTEKQFWHSENNGSFKQLTGKADARTDCGSEKCEIVSFMQQVPGEGSRVVIVAHTGEVLAKSEPITRKSNIETYSATVQGEELRVEASSFGNFNILGFVYAAIFTVVIELIVFEIMVGQKTEKGRLKLAAINLVTLPVIWFILPNIIISWVVFLILSELAAILAEFVLIKWLILSSDAKMAFKLAIAANAASFILGKISVYSISGIL